MSKKSNALAGAGCLLSFAAVADAAEIKSKTSSPASTATANSGAPDNLTVTDSGTIELAGPTGVAAITINSNHAVVVEGALVTTAVDNSKGVLIIGPRTSSIIVEGSISLDDDYSREDADKDDDLDGPYAKGVGRIGILVDSGGPFQGDIKLRGAGTIAVQGNQSAGIVLNSRLSGSLILDGAVSVVGDDARGVDLFNGASGDVLLSGSINAQGLNARGVTILGEIGGALTIESSIASTGFADSGKTNYADPDDLEDDDTPIADRIDAEDLKDNRYGVALGSSVSRGVLINGVWDTFTDDVEADDTTKDTIEDFDENRSAGNVTSSGSGPAFIISPDLAPGGVGDLVIGRVFETVRDTTDDDSDDNVEETLATFQYDYGFINRGTIYGTGLNVGYAGVGLRIEGSADGTRRTRIDGGLFNQGSISGVAYEANSVALSLGKGADLTTLRNVGTISATAYTETDHTSAALRIDVGATLPELYNSGTISSSVRGDFGSTTSVSDRSRTLRRIDNQGRILAVKTNPGDTDTPIGRAVAIDVSTHGAGEGVVIRQWRQTPIDDTNDDDTVDNDDVVEPRIQGAIVFGAGDDQLLIETGRIDGDVEFGAGADRFSLADAEMDYDVDFGAGADQFVLTNDAEYTGAIADSDQTLRITVVDSIFAPANKNGLVIDRIDLSGDSTLQFNVDLASNNVLTPRLKALTAATFGPGVTLKADVTGFRYEKTNVTVIESPGLSFAPGASTEVSITTPAIFTSRVLREPTRLSVELSPKSALDLGINRNETAYFKTLVDIATANEDVGTALASYEDEDELLNAYRSLAPFDQDAALRQVASEASLARGPLAQRLDLLSRADGELVGFWAQESFDYVTAGKDGDAAEYSGYGLGFHAGGDMPLSEQLSVGAAFSFITGEHKYSEGEAKQSDFSSVAFGPYGVYRNGRFTVQAAAAIGSASMASDRRVTFGDTSELVDGTWRGSTLTGSAKLAYEIGAPSFFARPQVTFDYARLVQKERTENWTSEGFSYGLVVGGATTMLSSATAALQIGRRGGDEKALAMQQLRYGGAARASEATTTFQTAYVGYRLKLDEQAYATSARFIGGGESFDIVDPRANKNAAVFGFAFGMSSEAFEISVGYDGAFEDAYSSHRATANFRMRF